MNDEYIIISNVLADISTTLSDLGKATIELIFKGGKAPCEGKISYEIETVKIPRWLISEPKPTNIDDKSDYYTVNRIRLSNIIYDYEKGYKFSPEEIKTIIKGESTWGYYFEK